MTSSSLEVLAALAFTDEEHQEHMCVEDGEPVPPFYQDYVAEVYIFLSFFLYISLKYSFFFSRCKEELERMLCLNTTV